MQKRPERAVSAASLVALVALALVAPATAGATGDGAAAPSAGRAGTPPAVRDDRLRDASTNEAPWRSAARANALSIVETDRAATGLIAYRRDPALDEIAQARAEHLAASGVFGHVAAGAPILGPVQASGVRPFAVGEALGWASDPSTDAAIARIRSLWLASPGHRAIVLADWANYAGIGVATDGTRTLVVLVIADTPDRTAPSASILSTSRAGSTVTVRWTADDPRLQTRTAGVGTVNVEYRADGGRWQAVPTACGSGVTVLTDVPASRALDVRVRARDRAGNLSPWASARVAIVP